MFGFLKKDKNKKHVTNAKTGNNSNKTTGNAEPGINIRLSKTAFLTIGDEPSNNMPIPPTKYMGKFLKKEDNIIIILISIAKSEPLEYVEDNVIGISFLENISTPSQTINVFSAKIIKISEFDSYKGVKAENYQDFINSAAKANCRLYILEVVSVTPVVQPQQRQYFRIDVSFPIYYKPFGKSVREYSRKNKRERYKERVDSFLKLEMINVSGGGFKCKTENYIEPDTIFDCKIIVRYEVLPVSVKVLETVSESSETGKNIYFIRANFHEVDEFIRDKLVKYIFLHQIKMQKNLHKRQ